VATLTGSTGSFGPTWGDFIAKLNKSTTKLLTLMMIATVGLQTGVAGTEAANKIEEFKFFSPKWENKFRPKKIILREISQNTF
jgi:hypothetical protein